MRFVLLVFALVIGPWAAGQETPPPEELSRSEEPPPPPTVTVSPVGIVVISGASKEEPAPEAADEGDKPEAEAKADEGSPVEKAPEEAGTGAEPDTPTPPKSSTVTKRGYDLGGRATPGAITISGHGTDTTRSTTRRLRNSSGRDVPYLTESEQVLSRTTAGRVTERRTHRYDTAGNAVSQQLVRNDMGSHLFNQGQVIEALEHFERAAELKPNDRRIQKNLALARKRAQGMQPPGRR